MGTAEGESGDQKQLQKGGKLKEGEKLTQRVELRCKEDMRERAKLTKN